MASISRNRFLVRNHFRCGIDYWRQQFDVKEVKISGFRIACVICCVWGKGTHIAWSEIYRDYLLFSVAQGIFWLSTERLSRSTLYLNEGGEGTMYPFCSLATLMSSIDFSVTKSPKVGPLLIFSMSLCLINAFQTKEAAVSRGWKVYSCFKNLHFMRHFRLDSIIDFSSHILSKNTGSATCSFMDEIYLKDRLSRGASPVSKQSPCYVVIGKYAVKSLKFFQVSRAFGIPQIIFVFH